jgi:hypothetical protein
MNHPQQEPDRKKWLAHDGQSAHSLYRQEYLQESTYRKGGGIKVYFIT